MDDTRGLFGCEFARATREHEVPASSDGYEVCCRRIRTLTPSVANLARKERHECLVKIVHKPCIRQLSMAIGRMYPDLQWRFQKRQLQHHRQ